MTKFGLNVFAGSSAGALGGAIADYSNNEDSDLDSMIKSAKTGAVAGALGGTASEFANGLSSQLGGTASKFVTKVGVQSATAAATDAGIQYYEKGEVDLNQTVTTTIGQAVLSGTATASEARAQKYAANADSHRRIDKDLKSGKITAEVATDLKANLKEINEYTKEFTKKRVGDSKMHKLDDRGKSMRGDQVAATVGDKKGLGRGVFEKVDGNYVYLDHTPDHNYKNCQPTMKGKIPEATGVKAVKSFGIMKHFEGGKNFVGYTDDDIEEMFNFTDNLRLLAPSIKYKLLYTSK